MTLPCLQRDITAIADCIDDLHLSINSSKCNCIIALKKNKQPHLPPIGLKLGGNIIEQVKSYRYLGVLINEHNYILVRTYQTSMFKGEKVNWNAL